ncbi:hypothetical protein ACP70R_008091 [Stipagrostis hirtigluma subsp. patula]
MALVGQVATVAQLVGVDAYGLITMIAEAARTVRRNRATCLQLARRVEMIGALLRQLHAAQTQLMQRPETRNPLEELEETLRRAYLLVRSCQRRGYAYRCFMGARHADELREVQGEIVFYLQLFPLVSYVDATLTWARHLSKAGDDASCQEAPMVRPYFVPFQFLLWDGCWLTIVQGISTDQIQGNLTANYGCQSVSQSCVQNRYDCKGPGSKARLPAQLDQSLSLPPLRKDE